MKLLAAQLVLAALVSAACCQSAEAQTSTLRFRRLGTEQGLSQSAVMAILQDRRGFVWLGTQDGLNRYDGAEFFQLRHHPAEPGGPLPNLSGNYVRALAEDRAGRLWIGTDTTGLDRYDPASGEIVNFRSHPDRPEGLPGNRVRALAVDGSGWLWVATADSGLARLDPSSGEAQVYRHDPADPGSLIDDNLSSLLIDRAGRLWVGTRKGLDCLDPQTGRFLHYLNDPGRGNPAQLAVRALHEDGRGRIWIGTVGGLDLLDPSRGSFRQFRPEPGNPYALAASPVRALTEDGFGRMWVGNDRGIQILDEEKGRFEHHRNDRANPASLSQDNVVSFYRDRDGLIWIGTIGGSANIWDPATRFFSLIQMRSGEPGSLGGEDIQAFAEIGDELFVGTLGGLNALDRATGKFTVLKASAQTGGLIDDRVMSLAADGAGALYIGTMSGLQRFDPRRRRFESWRHDPADPASLASDQVSELMVDRQGRLWVGTNGGGLDRFDPARGEFVHYPFAPGEVGTPPSNSVMALAEDDAGGLFVGTNGGGLGYLGPGAGRVTPLAGGPGELQGLEVTRSLHLDPRGALWVGTGDSGLILVESFDRATGRARIRRFADQEGAPNGTVWGIQPDSSGRLWLATNRGLFEFDPQRLRFRNFTSRHGLQSDEFNYGAHYRSARGELFFGGNHGYNSFFPEQLAVRRTPPPVEIIAISRRGAAVPAEALAGSPPEIELDHRDSGLSIDFAALDYSAPEENRYRFRLEGFDEAWSPPARSRRATFTNLDPGRYLFHVQAANPDGVWNNEGARLRVRVRPAPWETWWAVGLYLLFGAALLFYGIRWRLAGLERSRRELQALVARRTGELSQTVEQLRVSEQSALDAKMRALRALEDALEERRKAQDASRAKSTFLSNISHELRTPLNAVLGFAQLLERDDSLRADQQENLAVILRSGEHLLGLINDVLSFAKIESGRLTLTEAPFELRRVIRDVEDMMRVRADAKGLKLEVEVESALPNVSGDEGRLTQVLLNLLGNAVKFTTEGGVRLVAGWSAGRASFAVIDTGCGIEGSELGQLFQPFVQARGGRQQGEGTGLGLAICHKLVALMGGELEVSSELGAGSTFRFAIPLPATTLGEAAPRRGRVAALAPGQPPLRVLIADDAAENRDLLVRLLEPVGIEVRAAADGQAAVDLWSSWQPHLILMDIRMPILDGYGAIRTIRQAEAERGGRTPIVAITATAFEHDRRRMLAAGCDEVLTKPFRSQALFDLLAEQLDLRFVYTDEKPASGPSPSGMPANALAPSGPAAPPPAMPVWGESEPPGVKAAAPPPPDPPPQPPPAAKARAQPRSEGRAAGESLSLAGRRILVVDDNDANRLVAQRALERLGCRVDLAADGIEALETASVAAYDLIFMDVQMPRLDGIAATRRLRTEGGPSQDAPVVALTGLPTPDEYRRCLSAGMSDLLAKPFRLDDLRLAVERWAHPASLGERPAGLARGGERGGAERAGGERGGAEQGGAETGGAEPGRSRPAAGPRPNEENAPEPRQPEPRLLEDTREVYVAEIIKLFLETAPFQLEALRTAAAGYDLDRLAHLAATLRGSSLSFSAAELGAACQRLESLCSEGAEAGDGGGGEEGRLRRAKLGAAIDELAQELRRTIQQLRQLQSARAAVAGAGRH